MNTYGAGFTDDSGRFRRIGEHGFKLSKSIFNTSKSTSSVLSKHAKKHLHDFADKNKQYQKNQAEKQAYKEEYKRNNPTIINHANRLQQESVKNNPDANPYWNPSEPKKIGHDHQTGEDIFDDDSRAYPEQQEKHSGSEIADILNNERLKHQGVI